MSMLLLMRHSIAVGTDFQTTDESRWLTTEGRQLATVAGQALRKTGQRIGCIVCSPLVRTVQTADLVASCLSHSEEIRSMHCLRSEASSQRGLEELAELEYDVVLAISHEPIVSTMSALLTGESATAYRPSEIRCFEDGKRTWRHEP